MKNCKTKLKLIYNCYFKVLILSSLLYIVEGKNSKKITMNRNVRDQYYAYLGFLYSEKQIHFTCSTFYSITKKKKTDQSHICSQKA